MTPADFMDFADELGTQPKRIDVALLPHWKDALLAMEEHRWLLPTEAVYGTTLIRMWRPGGPVEIAYDPTMQPGEFAFRY